MVELEPLEPVQYGPWVPERLLATGAQAEVWLAKGAEGDEVALKIARGPEHHEALKVEAELLQRSAHPGLVALVDHDPKGTWLAMTRVRGTLVDQWSATREVHEILDVFVDVLDTLAHLHGKGVVHGDIKPSNLLVDEGGQPRLLDLGVAVLRGQARTRFKGTLGYAAPEVLQGGTPDARTDLYGLGATLYRCLTGRPVFDVPDPAALTYLPMVSLPAPPASFRPGLPQGLDEAVLALLCRDRSRRPADAPTARALLDAALQSGPAQMVAGMEEEREVLRRAVIGAADGETRIVVLYGPPGSGRATLAREAVAAAGREGIHVDEGSKPARNRPVARIVRTRRPAELVERILAKRPPGLFLLHTERPLADAPAGVLQLTPHPLSRRDARHLAAHEGVPDLDIDRLWEGTEGSPAAITARICAAAGGDPEQGFTDIAQQVVHILRSRGDVPVLGLATALRINPHQLLDHLAPVFALGQIVAVDDGATLHLAE